jgi:hypothetical protein
MTAGFRFLSLITSVAMVLGSVHADADLSYQENSVPDSYNFSQDSYVDGQCCGSDYRFIGRASFLYWRAAQEGLDTLVQAVSSASLDTSNPATGDSVFTSRSDTARRGFTPDWRPGFRVGGGIEFCDRWAITADYTHYDGRGHLRQGAPGTDPFVLDVGQARSSVSSDVLGRWSLNYDVLDVLAHIPLGDPCSSLTWDIFGGLKAGYLTQKIHLDSFSVTIVEFMPSAGVVSTTTTTQTGVNLYRSRIGVFGPEVGINLGWNLSDSLSVYGNAAGSIVFGPFNTRAKSLSDSRTTNSLISAVRLANTRNNDRTHDHLCRFVLDLGVGVNWTKSFCVSGHESTLLLQLGWEHHQWDSIERLGSRGGDLYLDGGVLSAWIIF